MSTENRKVIPDDLDPVGAISEMISWTAARCSMLSRRIGRTAMSARDDERGFCNNQFSVKFINENTNFTTSTFVWITILSYSHAV
jgi:hypothetical protein